jgi:general stress protein YciG
MQQDERQEQQRPKRGFAAMSPERQREIASQGGGLHTSKVWP